jgi:hypothetical protein
LENSGIKAREELLLPDSDFKVLTRENNISEEY